VRDFVILCGKLKRHPQDASQRASCIKCSCVALFGALQIGAKQKREPVLRQIPAHFTLGRDPLQAPNYCSSALSSLPASKLSVHLVSSGLRPASRVSSPFPPHLNRQADLWILTLFLRMSRETPLEVTLRPAFYPSFGIVKCRGLNPLRPNFPAHSYTHSLPSLFTGYEQLMNRKALCCEQNACKTLC